MGKTQTCILCEIIHNSKQEMDEHMGSMLHHRELENLKGRDCGHDCRPCGVTVRSLTEYADHISSLKHKQCMEGQNQQAAKAYQDEEYFDKEMVELIEKRKEFLRQEEEATLRRKREEQEVNWQQLKEHWQNDRSWLHKRGQFWGKPHPNTPQFARGWEAADRSESWTGPHFNHGNWNNRQNRCATWHAEAPPDLQRWESFNGRGGSLHYRENCWGGRQKTYGGFHPQHRNKSPWPNQKGNRGNYEKSISFHSQHNGHHMDSANNRSIPSSSPHHQIPHPESQADDQCQQRFGEENGHSKGSKTEKISRWAPYPPTSVGEPSSKDDSQISSNKVFLSHTDLNKRRNLNVTSQGIGGQSNLGSTVNKSSKAQQKKDEKQQKNTCSSKGRGKANKLGDTSSSSTSLSSFSSRRNEPIKHSDKKTTSSFGLLASPSVSSQNSITSKSMHFQSGSKSPQENSDLEQEKYLAEMLCKAKATFLKRPSSNCQAFSENRVNNGDLHIKESQLVGTAELNRAEERCKNKSPLEENSGIRKDILHGNTTTHHSPGFVISDSLLTESSPSLQSLQVSTSTMDRDDDESSKKEDHIQDQVMQAVDDCLGSDSDSSRTSHSLSAAGGSLPALSKLSLPASLKRDLNRHISTKAKAVAHEPNLNIARRIRNLSGSRKSESEKDTGLKPTLRQLIGSSASRRTVNWDQVYQEVHRKKQEQGKGLPRFGIEMIPCGPEGPNCASDDSVPLSEGFHWDALVDLNPQNKSNLLNNSVADNLSSPFSCSMNAEEMLPNKDLQDSSKVESLSVTSPILKECINQEAQLPKTKEHMEIVNAQGLLQDVELLDEESSCLSGTELNDPQNARKKRRAVGDDVSTEIPNSGRKNKRLKIKPKKEGSQFDELLAISLREEEMNSSLQSVDNSLIQARATLQAAYIEVQRLQMVKQQVTIEMSTLRTKRIEILQALKVGNEAAQSPRSCDESQTTTTVQSLSPSALPENVVHPSNPAGSSFNMSPLPAHSAAVVVKQERLSPSFLSPSQQTSNSPVAWPHSTTPEQSTMEPTIDATLMCNSKVEVCQKVTESALDAADMTSNSAMSDHILPLSSVPQTRRSSQEQALESPSLSISASLSPKLAFSKPISPSNDQETKAGKRVRKLKKKRVLRNAHGNKQPDVSDSELDTTNLSCRPQRKIRLRRRASGLNFSTTAAEEKEESMEVAEPVDPPDAIEQPLALAGKESQNSDSSELEIVELPQAVPTEVVNLDSDHDEKNVIEETRVPQISQESTCEKTEVHNLACNEVSSTSEIDNRSAVASCESVKTTTPMVKKSKASSDASSDPGEEDEPTEGSFEGHQEAVNSMQIHNGLLFTCSGDRTVRAFNLISRKCIAVFEGHTSKVNCLVVSSGQGLPQRLYSGSSDQTIRCYNIKTKECVQQLNLPDRVLCLHNRWKVLYAGLGNGCVVTYSLKNHKQLDTFECHGPRAVSCLATAQEGARRILLVGSYDTTISVRDAKSGLLLRTLKGHTKTVLCMKVVNDLVFSGSSDQSVHAHNIHTGELVRIYKGHSHAVTVVAILGKVMVTACLDKLVRVYELQSHDRLQVYGGHSDMVLCMVIHKSMIYTGCYNGSVQAIRLNLIQNYRCWWHGCSLIFGVMEHLQEHLLNSHMSSTQQMLKCRWRNCDSFFTSRNGFQQVVHAHMKQHAEEDSKLES